MIFRALIPTFLSLSFSVAGMASMSSTPLPNYATPEEIANTSPQDWQRPRLRAGQQPQAGLRLPAEYEPMDAVMMSYAAYPSFIQQMASAITQAGTKVYLLGGPSYLAGVNDRLYETVSIPFNTVWSRDYGPVAINELTGELAIIDTVYRHYAYRKADDAVPARLAQFLEIDSYQAPIILDGGNLMVDRRGHLYMTERTYDWNANLSRAEVDAYLKEYFGVKSIKVLPYAKTYSGAPADGTGHIDMFAKILGDCKLLLATSTDEPFASTLQQARRFFENDECAPGQRWQIYATRAWATGGVWYTYTNSLIVNDLVLIPSYRSGDNESARRIYEKALPGYELTLINADDAIRAAGASHCTTKEIPASYL